MNIDRKKIRIFLCALWPGGGYMYFGMMKKGTMVMALFTAVAGLTLTIGWKFLAFAARYLVLLLFRYLSCCKVA